jgi:hypothetical protein
MYQVPSLVVLLGLTLSILPSHKTMAQQVSENGVVYEAARNKIGLIRYCRKNELLDPAIADQASTAVEAGLRKLPPSDTLAREQGDRAQQAGEDGFWDVGRKRDIASVAKLFRTTPADLCQEWAGETLRVQERRGEVLTIAVVGPVQPFRPLPRAELTPVESIQADRRPARESAVVTVARSAPLPPLPEKAPFLPPEAEPPSLQHTLPTAAHLGSTGRGLRSSGQAVSLSARLPTQPTGSLPREQTAAAAVPSDRRFDQPRPPREKWFYPLERKRERCLMPGCKWPAPAERDYWR